MDCVEVTCLPYHLVPFVSLNRQEHVIFGDRRLFGSLDLFIKEVIDVPVEAFGPALVDYKLSAGRWYLILCAVNLPNDGFYDSEVRGDLG